MLAIRRSHIVIATQPGGGWIVYSLPLVLNRRGEPRGGRGGSEGTWLKLPCAKLSSSSLAPTDTGASLGQPVYIRLASPADWGWLLVVAIATDYLAEPWHVHYRVLAIHSYLVVVTLWQKTTITLGRGR